MSAVRTAMTKMVPRIGRSLLKVSCTVNADEPSCELGTLSNSAASASASLSFSSRVPYSALVLTGALWAPVLDPLPAGLSSGSRRTSL